MAGSYLSDNIYKQGLNYLDTNGTRIDICSASCTTYANITATTVGSAVMNVGSPTAGVPSGWMCVVPAVSNGNVTANGNAVYYAISNGSNECLVSGSLSGSQVVTAGNTWTLPSFNVVLPAVI